MTWFQIHAFVGGPLLVLLIALGVYHVTGRADVSHHRKSPGAAE
jgi:hypothetical protein